MVREWLRVENGCNGKPKGFPAERMRNGNPSDRCPFHTAGTGLHGGFARPVTMIKMRRACSARTGTLTTMETMSTKSLVFAPHCPIARSVWKVPCASASWQRNPVPFLRKFPQEKHMLSELLDAKTFKTLGMELFHSPGSHQKERKKRRKRM